MLDGIRAASQSFLGRVFLALVMGVIVFSFAIFGIGDIFKGFGAGKIAEVGSSEVTSEAYRFAYQSELQRLQRRAQRAVTNDEARALGLDRQVLGRLISEAAIDQKARALGLAMSDAEVARAISGDPAFKNASGQFDPMRFQEILRDNGFNERSFVQQQRAVYLRQEIAEAVAGKVAAPVTLLAAINRFQNETRSIDYFILPPSAAGEIPAPDDKALTTFFEDRRSTFAAPEFRKIVTLAVTPATQARAEDVSDADATKLYDEVKAARFTTPERRQVQQIVFPNEAEAQAAAQKIKDGGSFDAIIADRKLTAADVDLGLVKKADIGNKAVAEAAFALPEGGVSEPVKTQFGATLVHVTKIEPSQVKPFADVSPELKNEIARTRAKKQVRELHDKIEDARASGKSLTEAAKAVGLEARALDGIDSSGRDRDGKPIAGLVAGPEMLKAAFASDVGVDNETVSTPDDGYVWFEVAGVDPARQRSLTEVRDKVIAAWREEEILRKLAEKSAGLVKQLQDGADFAKLAAENGVEVRHNNAVKRAGGGDLPANAVIQIFDVPNGSAGSASSPAGRIVFKVLDDVVPAFDPDTPEAKQMAEQMNTALEQDILQQFVKKLESEAGVQINQAAFRAAVGGGSDQ